MISGKINEYFAFRIHNSAFFFSYGSVLVLRPKQTIGYWQDGPFPRSISTTPRPW